MQNPALDKPNQLLGWVSIILCVLYGIFSITLFLRHPSQTPWLKILVGVFTIVSIYFVGGFSQFKIGTYFSRFLSTTFPKSALAMIAHSSIAGVIQLLLILASYLLSESINFAPSKVIQTFSNFTMTDFSKTILGYIIFSVILSILTLGIRKLRPSYRRPNP